MRDPPIAQRCDQRVCLWTTSQKRLVHQSPTVSRHVQVAPRSTPFFVLHGTNDSLVPVEPARTFVEELRSASRQPVVYAELPDAQHAFEIFPSVRAHAAAHAVERFLAVVRSEQGGTTPAEATSGAVVDATVS